MNLLNKPFTTSILTIGLFFLSFSAFAGKDHFHATESEDENVRNKALTSKMWWNNKVKIEKLTLTDDQRHDMDHILGEYLTKFTKYTKSEKDAFKALNTALLDGDMEQAKAQKDLAAKTISTSLNEQIDIMIKITEKLSEEQRELIKKNYPALMSRLWIKSANPTSLQLGRSERKGKRGKTKKKAKQ